MKKSPLAPETEPLVRDFLSAVNRRTTNISAACEKVPIGRTSFYTCLEKVCEGEVRENHVAIMKDFLQAVETLNATR